MRSVLLVMNAESHFAVVWIKHYLRRGWQVHVVSISPLNRNIHLIDYAHSSPSIRNKMTNLRFSSPVFTSKTGILFVLLRYLALIGLLLRIRLEAKRYNLVHAHYLAHHAILCAFLFGANPPLVVSPYGSDIHAPLLRPVSLFYPYILNKAALVLVTSRQIAWKLVQSYPSIRNKIVVESWGIDVDVLSTLSPKAPVELSHSSWTNDVTLLVSYRTASPIYRIHVVLILFERMLAQDERMHLVIVTNSSRAREYVHRLTEQASRSPLLRGRVTIIDRSISHREIKWLLNRADYSFSIPVYDQLSSTVLESMYFKTIPIISNLEDYSPIRESGRVLVYEETELDRIISEFERLQTNTNLKREWQQVNRTVIKTQYNSSTRFDRILIEVEAIAEWSQQMESSGEAGSAAGRTTDIGQKRKNAYL